MLSLLPACGGDDGPSQAERRLDAARTSFLGATSVRLSGTLVQDGERVGVDVVLAGVQGGSGTLTVGLTRFRVVRIGEILWFNAPRSFYATQPALPVDLLAGRWLEAPAATGQFAGFAGFTRAQKVAERLLSSPGEVSEQPAEPVAGRQAVAIVAGQGRLVVEQAVPGRPLRAEVGEDVLVFSAYDAPVQLRKPADVVTAEQVQRARAGQGR